MLLQQLIHVVADNRTSKQEKEQALKSLLREKRTRHSRGAMVIIFCGCPHSNRRLLILSQALADSSTLRHVSDDIRNDFIAKLTTELLSDKRFELLYRGSRDGMTPTSFHDKCDGEGPTLVLVAGQSEGQPVCVFGGYAGTSWELGPEDPNIGITYAKSVDARDSFLFTVLNPFGDGIVRIAVNEESEYAGDAMECHAGLGPAFGDGFGVRSSSDSPAPVLDDGSWCGIWSNGTYGDPLGRGQVTFSGAKNFKPLEIEVWSVC
jgi:hypothetical protein